MGNAGQANYSSGKSGVVGLTKTLAKEWGQFKINVNAVAFGYIETRLTASKTDQNVAEIGGEKVQLGIPDQLRQMAAVLIPLGRPGTPEEAAGGVFFLCSPWSDYVHGQVLNITGGQFEARRSARRHGALIGDRTTASRSLPHPNCDPQPAPRPRPRPPTATATAATPPPIGSLPIGC